MRLSRLLDGLAAMPPYEGPMADPEVTGICHDSRRVAVGDLYVAIVGARFDGRSFVNQALDRGAVAVLGPDGPRSALDAPWIVDDAPRRLLGPLAARLYGHPDRGLAMVGVTGTNGKSTVVALIAAMLDAAGRPAARLGTLGYGFRGQRFAELDAMGRTTPEASDLFRVLDRVAAAGAESAVMEVSSHALDQGRVAGARFDVAVFTNLTRDHLDYHGDLESYFAAKRQLFEQRKPGGKAVVNVDDAYGRRLAAGLSDVVTFGTEDPAGAEVFVEHADLGFDGTRATLATPRGPFSFETGLLGRFNLANAVAAVAAAEALAIDRDAMASALRAQAPVRGRMEPIESGQRFPVIIDFAHTPGALEAAIASLRELCRPHGLRIAVVFGCGGEKDQGKRMPMGQAVARAADRAFATSDNPRGEDPAAILASVEEGLRTPGGCPYEVIVDRRLAIEAAVVHAGGEPDGWAILVAGKGHEAFQWIGDRRVPFSDHDTVAHALGIVDDDGAIDGEVASRG